jgi:putative membrane protein
MFKQAGMATASIGIAILLGLTVWSGSAEVAHAFSSVGWGILAVVVVRAITVAIAGAGWWLLFPSKLRPPPPACVRLRFLREGANTLLPLGQIGGDLLGAGALSVGYVRAALAFASVVADVLVQATTQLAFAMLGVLVLVALGRDDRLAFVAAIGLLVGAAGLGGFYLMQRCGGQRLLRWALAQVTGDLTGRVRVSMDALYESLAMIYAGRSNVAASAMVHMAGWLVGVAEVWIVLTFLGHPIGIGEAVVIESLLHAIRGAAFAIPGALGAQEGGLVLLCAVFGIPPEQAMALSLVKRAADLVIGVPALLSWYLTDMPRLLLQPRRLRSPPELVIGPAEGRTRWQGMTVNEGNSP